MAAKKGKYAKALSGSGRMLAIVGGVFLIGVVIAMFTIKHFTSSNAGSAQAKVARTPDVRADPTGEGADEEYQRMIREQNQQVVDEALRTGKSAIPTLVDGMSDEMCANDDECMAERARLAAELEDAARREAQLKADLEQARTMLEASKNPPQVNRSYYEHDGREFMTPEYREAERQRMRQEMQRIAAVHRPQGAGGFVASGYTPSRTEGSGQSSGNNAGARGAGSGVMTLNGQASQYQINAGTVLYSTLDMEANSDVPGPLRATLQGGKYNGAHVLGNFTVSNDYLVMRFNRMVMPSGEHLTIDAVAIDPERRLIGLADKVDRHYLQRFGALLGAAFLQGYGDAVIASREVTRSSEYSEEVVSTIDTTKDQALAALSKVGDELANVVRPLANRPPTVIKYADTGMGLLFLNPVE
jgi:intracellular multiplication protein IcmE